MIDGHYHVAELVSEIHPKYYSRDGEYPTVDLQKSVLCFIK